MRIVKIAALLVALLLACVALAEGAAPAQVGAEAPDFELNTLDGGVFRLSENRGKVVLLNIWATWCPPCAEEVPSIQQLAEAHPEDLVVIGASVDRGEDVVKAFIAENGVTYPVGMDVDYNLAAGLYPTAYIPESVFISPEGIVTCIRIGGATYEDFEELYTQALNGVLAEE